MLNIDQLTYLDDHPEPARWFYSLDGTGTFDGPFPVGSSTTVGESAWEVVLRVEDSNEEVTHWVRVAFPLQEASRELFVSYHVPAKPPVSVSGGPGPGPGIPVSGFTYADDTRTANDYRWKVDTGNWSSPKPLGSRSAVEKLKVKVISAQTLALSGPHRFSHTKFTITPNDDVDLEVHTHP